MITAVADPLEELYRLNDGLYLRNARRMFAELLPLAIPPSRIPILEWCEKNFVYPTGPRANQSYSRHHQPGTSLFLDMICDPYWRSATFVAPNQIGKSLTLVQFVMYCLFNQREDIIFGLPNIDTMWKGKWVKDFRPVINASMLRNQMPLSGEGSDGGTPKVIVFNNGRSLTVMGAGAGDSQRASATSRVVVVTELKDFGDGAAGSSEGAKVDQLKNRTRSEMGKQFFLGESTVTNTTNIAWTMWLEGTQTMAYFPCGHCEEFIAPEREHLVGWQDARTEEEAREKARFCCPVCGRNMDESDRRRWLQHAVALHKGQTVDRGSVIGDVPPTRNLSYRLSAATNMFADAGEIGAEEWSHKHEKVKSRREQKYRTLMQGVWGMAIDELEFKSDPLDGNILMSRTRRPPVGLMPAGTQNLFAGVDVRKTFLHWSIMATGESIQPRLAAWGAERIQQDIPINHAIVQAVAVLQDRFRHGFEVEAPEGEGREVLPVSLSVIDSGWKKQIVEDATDGDDFWIPVKGFGEGSLKSDRYKSPPKKTTTVRHIGEGFDIKWLDDRWVVHLDSNFWKSSLHEALRCEISKPEAMLISAAPPGAMRELISHLTAEVEEVSADAGISTSTFRQIRDENHLLDASSYANLARAVWGFLQELINPEVEEDDSFKVVGKGPLFGG